MIDWPGAPRARFRGAKLMLFAGDDLLVLRRDDLSWIDWLGYLDLPGGLRDLGETPEACVLRETREELGLDIPPALLRPVHLHHGPKGLEWFFAAHGSEALIDQVRFGDEGQGWKAMRPNDFVAAEDAIPQFRAVLAGYLKSL